MKLPISIFPNVTEYTKANWTGYLKPAAVHLDSYTIREEAKDVTSISQRPDGVIVMKKKANNAWGQGDYNVAGSTITISNIPANSKLVIIHEMIADAPDLKVSWDKTSATDEFAGNPTTKVLNTSRDGKHELVKVNGSKTVVSGTITLSVQYGYEGYHTVYFAFFDADRLDACLTGNHLKSISVGDKLGLVYWDGTKCRDTGASIKISTKATSPTGTVWQWVTVRNTYDKGLSLFDAGRQIRTLLTKAGTINLGFLDATVNTIETTNEPLLKDHLFHVI